jgi:hypothetical protein
MEVGGGGGGKKRVVEGEEGEVGGGGTDELTGIIWFKIESVPTVVE